MILYIYSFLFSYYFNSTRGHKEGLQRRSRTDVIFFFCSLTQHKTLKQRVHPHVIILSFTQTFMQLFSIKEEKMWILKARRTELMHWKCCLCCRLHVSICQLLYIKQDCEYQAKRLLLCSFINDHSFHFYVNESFREKRVFVIHRLTLLMFSVFIKTLLHSWNIIF